MPYQRPYIQALAERIKEPRKLIQVVMGPRQVGKTTLVDQLLKKVKVPHQFISADSNYYADRLVAVSFNRVDILSSYPRSGRMVPEKEDETIRELIEGNYRIFYKIFPNGRIAVLRINHSAKNIK